MAQAYTKITSLTKGLKVLDIIGNSALPKMVKDISKEAEITYSTTMNIIITLEDAGFILKQGQGYIVSSKLANIWSNRMSYLKRKKEVLAEEIRSLEIEE